MPTNHEINIPPNEIISVNHTNEPSISLRTGISTLSLRPQRIGIMQLMS